MFEVYRINGRYDDNEIEGGLACTISVWKMMMTRMRRKMMITRGFGRMDG